MRKADAVLDEAFEIRALESLGFDGEPDRETVLATKEKLMKLHGSTMTKSIATRRVLIAAAFLATFGVGAFAGPHMLEWWEHLTVVTDEPLPDGAHHVVIDDDEGNTVMDTTLQPGEALLQIEPDGNGGGGQILQVRTAEGDDAPQEAPEVADPKKAPH